MKKNNSFLITSMFSLMVLVLTSGCQSTKSNTNAVFDRPQSVANNSKSLGVTFEEKPISAKPARKAAQQFDTVTLKEYKLQEHTLYQANFTNNILFDTDKAQTQSLTPHDVATFAKLYRNGQLGKKIFIVGHTDSRGSESYNLQLSLRRAMFIATLLHKNGVKADAIKLVPAGEYLPAAPNKRKSYALNRRVEVLSADSDALLSSFIRERDCSDIDPACSKVQLPLISVRNENNELNIRTDNQASIYAGVSEINDLGSLAQDLTRLGASEVDKRAAKVSEEKRGKLANINTRDVFSLEILVRPTLSFKQNVRKVLSFPNQHIVN